MEHYEFVDLYLEVLTEILGTSTLAEQVGGIAIRPFGQQEIAFAVDMKCIWPEVAKLLNMKTTDPSKIMDEIRALDNVDAFIEKVSVIWLWILIGQLQIQQKIVTAELPRLEELDNSSEDPIVHEKYITMRAISRFINGLPNLNLSEAHDRYTRDEPWKGARKCIDDTVEVMLKMAAIKKKEAEAIAGKSIECLPIFSLLRWCDYLHTSLGPLTEEQLQVLEELENKQQ